VIRRSEIVIVNKLSLGLESSHEKPIQLCSKKSQIIRERVIIFDVKWIFQANINRIAQSLCVEAICCSKLWVENGGCSVAIFFFFRRFFFFNSFVSKRKVINIEKKFFPNLSLALSERKKTKLIGKK
jgi:hypothetical protein